MYPLAFLVGFYIQLDSLANELVILTKAQPYHFTLNSWHILGEFRYFNENLGLKLDLDGHLHLYQVRYWGKRNDLSFASMVHCHCQRRFRISPRKVGMGEC